MKINLTKYEIKRLTTCPTDELIKAVIDIAYKHAIGYETQVEEKQRQINDQVFRNKAKNKLLDLVMFKGLSIYYKEKYLLNDPEGYLEKIENLIKKEKNATNNN